MSIVGGETIARNIHAYGGGFLKHVNKTMVKVKKVVDKEITKNMSLTDHSLKDLARLGHPYARRYGMMGRHLHTPYWQVHKQSGQLLGSKKSGTDKASITLGRLKASAWVELDEGRAAYAPMVIYGTSKMIPRDFMRLSLKKKAKEAVKILRENLRDFTFKFRGI